MQDRKMKEVSHKEFYNSPNMSKFHTRVIDEHAGKAVIKTHEGIKLGEIIKVTDHNARIKYPTEYRYFLDEDFMESMQVVK